MRKFIPFVVLVVIWCIGANFSSAQHHGHQQRSSRESRLHIDDNRSARRLTIRHGPFDLPSDTHHFVPPISLATIPFDGWILAYRPRLTDGRGTPLPRRLLHHIDLFNTARLNFLCPRHDEYIFASGTELQDWPRLPGLGYRVSKGDRVVVRTMLNNDTATPFRNVYAEVSIEYRLASDGATRNYYPAWFAVTGCGPTDYDLKPGRTTKSEQFTIPYSGRLLGVGGHMHDYGRHLLLENVTRNEPIATLTPKLDDKGRLQSVPITMLSANGGYRLSRGDIVKVNATYDNPTGRELKNAAMGIVVGYFLPASDRDFDAFIFRRSPRLPGRSPN